MMAMEELFRSLFREELHRALREELDHAKSGGTPTPPAACPSKDSSPQMSLFNVGEVAKLTHKHVSTVRGWIHAGRLRANRSTGHYLVRATDLQDFLNTSSDSGRRPPADVGDEATRLLRRMQGEH